MANLSYLENASFFANVAVSVLGVLAALAAVVALVFSLKLSAAKDRQLEQFQATSESNIANANARAAEANLGATEASARAKALELEVEKQKTQFEEQKERTASAESALLKLQIRMAPRAFSPEQRRTLIRELTPFAGQRVNIFAEGRSDPEAAAFGDQLLDILRRAGWKTEVTFIAPIPRQLGLILNYSADNKAAASLWTLLREAGFTISGTALKRMDPNFEIHVGTKPPA